MGSAKAAQVECEDIQQVQVCCGALCAVHNLHCCGRAAAETALALSTHYTCQLMQGADMICALSGLGGGPVALLW